MSNRCCRRPPKPKRSMIGRSAAHAHELASRSPRRNVPLRTPRPKSFRVSGKCLTTVFESIKVMHAHMHIEPPTAEETPATSAPMMVMAPVGLAGLRSSRSNARLCEGSAAAGSRSSRRRKCGARNPCGVARTGRALAGHTPGPRQRAVPPDENTVRMSLAAPRTAWCANVLRGDRAHAAHAVRSRGEG